MEKAADKERGRRAVEWTRDDRQQQINHQPGRDIVVKAKDALAVNGAFCHRVDHCGGRKVGSKGRVAVDNRQQWQQ